ncbi:hypothetical protein PFISCL1PPCAC_28977, partial [Pristionchus fissidentatus]
ISQYAIVSLSRRSSITSHRRRRHLFRERSTCFESLRGLNGQTSDESVLGLSRKEIRPKLRDSPHREEVLRLTCWTESRKAKRPRRCSLRVGIPLRDQRSKIRETTAECLERPFFSTFAFLQFLLYYHSMY